MMNFEYKESNEDMVLPFGNHRSVPSFEGEITKGIHEIIERALIEFSRQTQFRKFRNPSLEKYRKQVQENEKRLSNLFGPKKYDPSVEYYLSDEEGIGEKKEKKRKKNESRQVGKREKAVISRTPLLMKKKKGFITFNRGRHGGRHLLSRPKNSNVRPYQQKRSLSSYQTLKRNRVIRIRKNELLVRHSQKKKRPSSTGKSRNSVGSSQSSSNVSQSSLGRTGNRGRWKRRDSAPTVIKVRSKKRSNDLPSVSSTPLGKKPSKNLRRSSASDSRTILQNISFPEPSRDEKLPSPLDRKNNEVSKVFGRGRNSWGRNSINSFDRGYISNLRREIKKKNRRRKVALQELKKEKVTLQKKLNDFKKKNQIRRNSRSSGRYRHQKKRGSEFGSSKSTPVSRGGKVVIPKNIKNDYKKYLEIKKKIKELENLGKLVSTRRKKKKK